MQIVFDITNQNEIVVVQNKSETGDTKIDANRILSAASINQHCHLPDYICSDGIGCVLSSNPLLLQLIHTYQLIGKAL